MRSIVIRNRFKSTTNSTKNAANNITINDNVCKELLSAT